MTKCPEGTLSPSNFFLGQLGAKKKEDTGAVQEGSAAVPLAPLSLAPLKDMSR